MCMLVCVILLKYCIYLYIYYVPATKLCNKDKFSLKMLRRTIKVFYITYILYVMVVYRAYIDTRMHTCNVYIGLGLHTSMHACMRM